MATNHSPGEGGFGLIQKGILFLLRQYQRFISPVLGSHCRFYPSCSQYWVESLQTWGLFKGFFLGLKRLLRCHPYCEGGFDPVPLSIASKTGFWRQAPRGCVREK